MNRFVPFFISGVKSKQDSPQKEAASDVADSEFDEAFSQLCDPFLPTRGHALMRLAKLLYKKCPRALENADTLLRIFQEQLTHDDSYIYLAAIQGLVSSAGVKPDVVMPLLAKEFACYRKNTQNNQGDPPAKEQGLCKPNKKGTVIFSCTHQFSMKILGPVVEANLGLNMILTNKLYS